MPRSKWGQSQEDEYKDSINKFFDKKIQSAIKRTANPLKVGDKIADLLVNSDEDIVKIVTPRAINKWASSKTFHKWKKIIKDPQMVLELRNIGKSIANTMRPLAGHNFTFWVGKILNSYFLKYKMPLKAITSGIIKWDLNKALVKKLKKGKGIRDYKPDIDIILIRTDQRNTPIAIISAKTTLAERIMQTISWSRYLKYVSNKYRDIKLYLVTAWETFESGANKERVQELEGVYVCNDQVKEYGNIKRFSKIAKDLKALCQ